MVDTAVVCAAGYGRIREGQTKLLEAIDDMPLLAHVMDPTKSLPPCHAVPVKGS